MNKTCSTCKNPNLTARDFASNKAKPDGLHNQCRGCKKKSQDKWYEDHKQEHIKNVAARAKRYRQEVAVLIYDYLKEHSCVDCPETDPVVLEFDHVRGQKTSDIASMIRDQRPWTVIQEEISKCQVRCANCHRRKTARERGTLRFLLSAGSSTGRAADS